MNTKKDEVAVYSDEFLKGVAGMGMQRVDPMDIRPPQVLLIQASSDTSAFNTPSGENPVIGQFFHTGRNEIMDTFECFFLVAAKCQYTDKNKNPPEVRDQYRTIGVMTDDFKPFMMNFRSSAMYALSSLFTAVTSQSRPMFSIKVKIETKELQNNVGKKWKVPVVRIVGPETDQEILDLLYSKALVYDKNITKVATDEDIAIPDEIPIGEEPNSGMPF